ncbi:MAG: 4Fe-4S dicluster domain-containing protein [Gammaproteobacteria bacterium]|nr:4Fe-4S dicluster domain-containing protein [Gammaproteobacteria bacterium]
MPKFPQPMTDSDRSAQARRRFLKGIGALGASAVVSSATVVELNAQSDSDLNTNPSTGVTSAQRWGLYIDTDKCSTGCDACVRGCNEEHRLESTGNKDTDAQWIRKLDLKDKLTGKLSSLPMMCQHCDSAPCVDVCPTGASFKRADGVVLVNKHTCIGCRYCMMACPFKARSFIHETLSNQKSIAPRGKGTVESCTLCVHRIDAGGNQQTACADACTAEGYNAIVFGDLNDPESQISKKLSQEGGLQVRADLELNTGVRYKQF